MVNGIDGFGSYGTMEVATVILLAYSSLSDSYICVTPNNVDYANLAGNAKKLSVSNVGSETQPVYIKSGEPVACDMYNYQKNPIQRIGTWFDGRGIYRVVWETTLEAIQKSPLIWGPLDVPGIPPSSTGVNNGQNIIFQSYTAHGYTSISAHTLPDDVKSWLQGDAIETDTVYAMVDCLKEE